MKWNEKNAKAGAPGDWTLRFALLPTPVEINIDTGDRVVVWFRFYEERWPEGNRPERDWDPVERRLVGQEDERAYYRFRYCGPLQ